MSLQVQSSYLIMSRFCARAVHQAQSLGLHLQGHYTERTDQTNTTLLCCIWAIDRLNAALNGRPVLMHERDLRQDLGHCFEQQEPGFRLLLEVISLLDTVIGLYRPQISSHSPTTLHLNFPDFEDVVSKCCSADIGTSALGLF